MKKPQIFFCLFVAMLMLTACEDKTSDDTVEVSTETLVFPAMGGTAEFQILSSTEWEIIVSGDRTDIGLSQTIGVGHAQVAVTLPQTNSLQDVETRLMVRAKDGSSIRNVVLRQQGHLLSGQTLGITNWANLMPMDGTAGATDSLTILSNVPWQLTGPEWMEVLDGNTWKHLSPDLAVVTGAATVQDEGNQTTTLWVRTASANNEETDRMGTLTLAPAYDSGENVTIDVKQLGRHRVEPNQTIILSNALGWTWKCGKDVTSIKVHVDYPSYIDQLTTIEQVAAWDNSSPEYVCGIDNLRPSTPYAIFAFGFDATGQTIPTPYYYTYETMEDAQPLATISNVDYDFTTQQWSWLVTQNEASYGFFQMVLTDPDWMTLNDGYIAWLFSQQLHNTATTADYPMWLDRTHQTSYATEYHIQVVTWGVAQGSNHMSGRISRFDTETEWTGDAKARQSTGSGQPSFVSLPREQAAAIHSKARIY